MSSLVVIDPNNLKHRCFTGCPCRKRTAFQYGKYTCCTQIEQMIEQIVIYNSTETTFNDAGIKIDGTITSVGNITNGGSNFQLEINLTSDQPSYIAFNILFNSFVVDTVYYDIVSGNNTLFYSATTAGLGNYTFQIQNIGYLSPDVAAFIDLGNWVDLAVNPGVFTTNGINSVTYTVGGSNIAGNVVFARFDYPGPNGFKVSEIQTGTVVRIRFTDIVNGGSVENNPSGVLYTWSLGPATPSLNVTGQGGTLPAGTAITLTWSNLYTPAVFLSDISVKII